MKQFLFIIALVFVSCRENKVPIDNGNTYYTIEAIRDKNKKEYDEKVKQYNERDSTTILSPPIPAVYEDKYYSNHNFIIDSLNHIYYFYQPEAYPSIGCGYGLDLGPFPAPFIKLYPEDIINLSGYDFETFFKSRVIDSIKPDERMVIFIGSQKDSFQSSEIDKLFRIFKHNYENRYIDCRRTTEQENIVLHYKKSGKPYNPELIKWDSTKTNFKNKAN